MEIKITPKKYICKLVIVTMLMVFILPQNVFASVNPNIYTDIIEDYYQCINNAETENVRELYGDGLNSFVSDFFKDPNNKILHQGIYNVQNVEVLHIENIESMVSYGYGEEQYSDVKIYFVKCNMNTYVNDKYYQTGNNYFLFYIGTNENGELKIANIEIPSYEVMKQYDVCIDDVENYYQNRNQMIYGNSLLRLTDRPVYIDIVRNPSTIRVEGYSEPIAFLDYCKGVAANEINTLTTDNAAYAGAMVIKMYAIHFVNTAASGANYDINATTQVYNPSTQISDRANRAVEYVHNYFLLGGYGENFKTFYYTQYNAQSTVGRYAYQNGGVLSHVEANSLGENGMSWQNILRYYYVKVSGTSYIPNAKESDSVIITTTHVHDWSNAEYCPTCGALVY